MRCGRGCFFDVAVDIRKIALLSANGLVKSLVFKTENSFLFLLDLRMVLLP